MAKGTSTPTVTGWRYVGGGAYVPGVPARDLTPEEMAEFAQIVAGQVALTGQPLYEPVYEPQPEAEGSE